MCAGITLVYIPERVACERDEPPARWRPCCRHPWGWLCLRAPSTARCSGWTLAAPCCSTASELHPSLELSRRCPVLTFEPIGRPHPCRRISSCPEAVMRRENLQSYWQYSVSSVLSGTRRQPIILEQHLEKELTCFWNQLNECKGCLNSKGTMSSGG